MFEEVCCLNTRIAFVNKFCRIHFLTTCHFTRIQGFRSASQVILELTYLVSYLVIEIPGISRPMANETMVVIISSLLFQLSSFTPRSNNGIV